MTLKADVNGFYAAICVSADEINKQFKEIFDKDKLKVDVDGFPKAGQQPDLPHLWIVCWNNIKNPTQAAAQAEKDQQEFLKSRKTPDGLKNYLKATLGAPAIDFDTDLTNGVRLNTPIAKGRYHNKTFVALDGYDPSASAEENRGKWRWDDPDLDLAGKVFTIATPMRKDTHVAGAGQTVDEYFDVRYLYMDLQDAKNQDAKMAIDLRALHEEEVQQYSDLATKIYNHVISADYPHTYVIGAARLPNIEATKGPLAPTGVMFSTWSETKKSSDTSPRKGCLNWNLIKGPNSEGQLADIEQHHKDAGSFSDDPIPDGQPGVAFISWKTIIDEVIRPQLHFPGLDQANDMRWDDQECALVLNTSSKHLRTTMDSQTIEGDITGFEIKPDLGNNFIRMTLTVDNVIVTGVEKVDSLKTFLGAAFDWIHAAAGKDAGYMTGKWSFKITPSIDAATKQLICAVVRDDEASSTNRHDPSALFDGVAAVVGAAATVATVGMAGIALAGMASAAAFGGSFAGMIWSLVDMNSFFNTIESAFKTAATDLGTHVSGLAEMPGKNVFHFGGDPAKTNTPQQCDATELGLRIPLHYEPATATSIKQSK